MRVRAHEVAAYVADLHRIPIKGFYGAQRTRHIARARQVAMYCIRYLCPHMSYPRIGKMMGGRDHTTVLHGVKNIEALIKTDPEVLDAVERVLFRFSGKASPEPHQALPEGNAWLLMCHRYSQVMRLAA